MNTEILDGHIEKITEEIRENEKYILETKNLPVNDIITRFKKQAELGQLWQWLNQVKASKQKAVMIRPASQLIN